MGSPLQLCKAPTRIASVPELCRDDLRQSLGFSRHFACTLPLPHNSKPPIVCSQHARPAAPLAAPSDQSHHRLSPAIAMCGLLIVSAGLRLLAARGDLWLDELWSLSFARQMTSPLDVWTAIHHDNNHPLNTLYLFVVVHLAGAHASPMLFRLLSLVSGAAMLVVLFRSE